MRGLLVHVLRDAGGGSTNGGVSSTYDAFILVGPGVDGPFEPSDDCPALVLVRRNISGEYLHVEPPAAVGGMVGPMFGGNFVYTSDSRFPGRYPIPVHDRYESPE